MQQRILIVDDEPSIARTLAAIVEREGYVAQFATSGEQALAVAPAFRPDILLTDYAMPGMSGFDLSAAIAHIYPGCRIFVLTAYSDAQRFPKVKDQPPATMLIKPLPPVELLKAIAQPDVPIVPSSPVILNVDDVEPHRYSITRLLARRGLMVVEAASGREALEKLAIKPDAVLLDVNLPDIDGFEVCRRIRGIAGYDDLPIVHFTATYRNEIAAAESRQAGANDFLEQPVDPDLLVAKIRELIQKHCLRAK